MEVFENREADFDFREIKALLEFDNLEAMRREGVSEQREVGLAFYQDVDVADITRVVIRSMNGEWDMLEIASLEHQLFAANSFTKIDILEEEGSSDSIWEGEDLS